MIITWRVTEEQKSIETQRRIVGERETKKPERDKEAKVVGEKRPRDREISYERCGNRELRVVGENERQ